MSTQIRIHVFHCGEVCTSPYLPYGGENCNLLKASGLTMRKKDRVWLPVSAYLIEHPNGLVLFDTGWHRNMSPKGNYDRKAQIKFLGSALLYEVNQGRIRKGAAINELLANHGITPQILD